MNNIAENIYKLRTYYKLTQEQFAEFLNVSRQAVQKWENGQSVPDLEKLIKISARFGVSLDTIILNTGKRLAKERTEVKQLAVAYENQHHWESYPGQLLTEYRQSIEEGKDIKQYKGLFNEVMQMPSGKYREDMADILFNIVCSADTVDGYKYIEPSEIESIKRLRDNEEFAAAGIPNNYREKLYGAWMGRICGCLLGKPIEGRRTYEFIPLLKESDNYPMHRYIVSDDITEEMEKKFNYSKNLCWADRISCAPVDDDTNYTVLANVLIEKCTRDFTPKDVADLWQEFQGKNAYCTAERIAFKNFVAGYEPPVSAVYKNPFREWIGAQIRGDYFGYINPGNPEAAAEMAWRDASISHVKNGIYGEMFAAAMISYAAVCSDIKQIIAAGLSQIPNTSRLYEAVKEVIDDYENGISYEDWTEKIYQRFDECTEYDWCHTISNAMIVTAALLYGNKDFGKSICIAVQTGFDTDCNGATVGSIVGMINGISKIDKKWTEPIGGVLDTSIFGVGKVNIEEMVDKTLKHLVK